MTNRKNTRRALLMSTISLVLCISMLVGTTFAWFTDEVKSGMNTIVAGNLDVELYHSDKVAQNELVRNDTILFDDVKLWEPGAVVYENLTVENKGDLTLKYQLTINFSNEVKVGGKGLSEVLKVAVIDNGVNEELSREELLASVPADKWQSLKSFSKNGKLDSAKTDLTEVETSNTYGIVIYWEPSDRDNEFNMNNGQTNVLSIDLGVHLFATQLTAENDSFDNSYDADTAVFTVADANAMMLQNKPVTLAGCVEEDGILEVPAEYTETLTLINSTIKSVQGAGNVNLVIMGNVEINANGSGVATVAEAAFDGSAICANGKLTISGTGYLTAIAADVKGAFGIGGMNATEVNIQDITIDYVSGGYAYGVGSDTKYYKDAPEGGAAIGSGYDGAVITLNNVTITKAIGGSKAAGIGARYHVGVTVNITKCAIGYVEGGVSAAGIGGSRVSSGASENDTVINITASTITAQGGAYGAGIGSGYDTHCQEKQPLCTINITDSTINATGGKYAAGVGSGYHNAALTGEIKNSTVNAVSGEKFYKDSYTMAQDVGFGVVDPAREGQQTDSKLIYNGTEITIPEVIVIEAWETIDVVTSDTTVSNKVAEDYVEICHKGGDLTIKNVTFKNGLTIYNEVGTTGTVTLENCTIYLSNGTPANTAYNMCKADYGMYVGAISTNVTWEFKNCTFTAAEGHTYAGSSGYNVYIAPNYNAVSFTFEDCDFEKSAKHGIGCSSDSNASYYALTVTGCNFKDWNNNATNGAAIRGNLPSGDFAANITISGNTFGNSNESTQKTVAIDSWNGNWN